METGSEMLTPSTETSVPPKTGHVDHLSSGGGDHLSGGGEQTKKANSGGGGSPPPPPNPSLGGNNGAPNGSGPPPPPKPGGSSGKSDLEENKEVLVSSQTSTTTPNGTQQSAKPGGGAGLTLPAMTSEPFTVSDMTMPMLDTSKYMLKMRAKKAQGMHDQISKVVQTKIGYLVGIGNEIAQIHASIDTAASQHVAGLAESQGTLTSHIGASRAALCSESEAAVGRVKAIIGAERGAISAKANTARALIRTATSSMEGTLSGAHQTAIGLMEADYTTAGGVVTAGTANYKTRIGSRMKKAERRLAIPASDDLTTCVHYRVSKALGKKFNDNGPLFDELATLEEAYNTKLSEAYGGNLEKLAELCHTGQDSADKAKRSGYNQVRSFERSALASLDETETKVLGQIDTATTAAAASLDTIEQERTSAIQSATQQTDADAAQLKGATEAAMWAHARGQGESLVAAADAASEPLEQKPSKKTVKAALGMIEMIPLDITTSAEIGQRMVVQWSMGHSMVQSDLDGSAGNAAAKWTQDALSRVKTAEQKSIQSVMSTSEGSQNGLESTAQSIVSQISLNKGRAVAKLKEQAKKVGSDLIGGSTSFIESLDSQKSLDTSTLDELDSTISKAKSSVSSSFSDRSNKAYEAMFDVPGIFDCTDETKLFAALKGIGGYGADALAQVYRENVNRNLYADIYSECTAEEYKICQAYFSDNDARGTNLEVSYHSNRFWGPDEASLKSLLKSLSKEELAAVKQQPNWANIEKELYENLEGDDLNLRVVQSLVAGNKSRAEALELINKITDARWDEDLDALRNAVEGIPAKDRKNILVQFAVLQELAGRSGGLDAVDFTAEEVDEDLVQEMGQDAVDESGQPITVTNDDLSQRNLSKGEKRFGAWAAKDDIHDDALYKEGGPGFTDVAQTTVMISVASPLTAPINAGMAYQLEKSGASNDRSLGSNAKDLIENQATYGSTSMQGRAAGLHYETTEGDNVEKAYKNLNYDHTDKKGKVTNSAFHSTDEREDTHKSWRENFDATYKGMYGNSAQSDINQGDFNSKERNLLQETRKGGQGSAETMIDYAQDGMGTEEWAAYAAFEDAPQEKITAYFKKNPEARKRLLSEFSGDELLKMQLLMLGKIETDRQRWDAAKIRWDFTRGSGSGSLNLIVGGAMGPSGAFLLLPGAPKISSNLFWDLMTDSGRVMDLNYNNMQKMIQERGGEDAAFDESGMLVALDGDESGSALDQQNAFRRQESSLQNAEAMYHKSTDALTDLIATVAGIVVGAAVTIFTAGAASPVVVTLLSGLTTMVAQKGLKGDRYGVEKMALDAGVLAIELATASLASKVTKAAKVSDAKKLNKVVPVSAADLAKYELPKNVALGIKAGESFASSTGKTLIDDKTYDKGVSEGILKAFQEGLKGAGSTYIGNASEKLSGNIAGGIEKKLDIQSSWARQSLKVAETGLNSYMSGQTNLAVGDIITGENNFSKKQLSLAENAILAMATKTLSVKDDVEADDLKKQLEENPDEPELKAQLQEVEDRIKAREPYISAGFGTLKTVYDKK